MPSLRQRVSGYFRQLSFIAEPHRVDPRFTSSLSPRNTPSDGCFITKYLEGRLDSRISSCGPLTEILHGKEPSDLPDLMLRPYDTGPQTIIATCTGPDKGLTAIKRSRAHFALGDDIDFIDTSTEDPNERKSEPKPENNFRFRYQQQFKQNFSKINNTQSKPDRNANTETVSLAEEPLKTGETLKLHQMTTKSESGGKVNIIVRMISTTQMAHDNTKLESSCPCSYNKNIEIPKGNISPNENTIYTGSIHGNKDDISNDSMTFNTITSPDEYAGISNWKMENDDAFGVSVSLYENNLITQEPTGNPIADCYGLVARGNSIAMALADGVNWGEGACIAARSAVQGSLEYLDKAVFGQVSGSMAKSTREIFVSLLRSFSSAHACILETAGSLTTLTCAVILPLADQRYTGKSVVCCCNVGDSWGYVYSKERGVREFTQGSHDVNSMRDMRDALGALGPVDGINPELGNLTCSMTIVEADDIVFLVSDGVSDNCDPVVGKFADAITDVSFNGDITSKSQPPQKQINIELAPKRQNKSTSAIVIDSKKTNVNFPLQKSETQPIRPPRRLKKESPMSSTVTPNYKSNQLPSSQARPKFLRSHTVIEPLHKTSATKYRISPSGLPLVNGSQRHALTLLRIEDLLSFGIDGTLQSRLSARRVCNLLIDFVKMITSAKRRMLEQRELFYKVSTVIAAPDAQTGTSSGVVKKEVEMNRNQQKTARKRVVDGPTFSMLPGKLDHATVVAVRVPSITEAMSQRDGTFVETNF